MQDQIYTFIQRCGGHASSLAIAAHVLRLHNATPATAERVVGALLKTESRFINDGLGNWYLAQPLPTNLQAERTRVCLLFTPMRVAELKQAQRLLLGWKILPDEPQHFFAITLQSEARQNRESHEFENCGAAEFVQQRLPALQNCALLAWNLSAVLLALRRITTNFAEAWLPPTRISLQNLSRHLLRLSRPPKVASVYQQLLHAHPRSESWQDQIQAQVEIWGALQSHCTEQGLENFAQIAHYAQRSMRSDFSQYAFKEKDIEALPETPGVYVMQDQQERVIYVGKSSNLRERVLSYFANAHSAEAKLQKIRARVARFYFEKYDTELEALLREQSLIKRLRPEFNRQVEVHAQAVTPREKLRGIFLVPLRERTAAKRRVIIYFLAPQKLQRVLVNLARIPRARIGKAVADYLTQSATSLTSEQRTQSEIARRWFQQNRSWISSISSEESDDAAKLTGQLLDLLRSPEVMHERVELAAQ